MTNAHKWMHISPNYLNGITYGISKTKQPGAFVKWCDQTFGPNKFLVAGEGAHGEDLDRSFPFSIRNKESSNDLHFDSGGMMCVEIKNPERLPIVFAFIFEKMNELETRDKELHQQIHDLEQKLEHIHTDMKKQQKSFAAA